LNTEEDLEGKVSELLAQSIESGDPEDFWNTINMMVSLAVSASAYRFGKEKEDEIVEHIVNIVLDTYASEKHFYIKGSRGETPRFH
jgi:hypothetical protein